MRRTVELHQHAGWARRGLAAWARIRLSTAWLLAVGVTTAIALRMSHQAWLQMALAHSTNLDNLAHGRWHVLATSMFWLDDPGAWATWVAYIAVFVVPLEWCLGSRRWLAVVLTVHVVPSLITQAWLEAQILRGPASPQQAGVLDVGVSYVVVGCAAALSAALPGRILPWGYASGIAGYVAVQSLPTPSLTGTGHLLALGLGLAAAATARVCGRRPAR